jgi:hypothetical protein
MDDIHAESVEEQMISMRRPDRRSAYSRYSNFEMENGDASLPDGEYIVVFGMRAIRFRKSGKAWEWMQR